MVKSWMASKNLPHERCRSSSNNGNISIRCPHTPHSSRSTRRIRHQATHLLLLRQLVTQTRTRHISLLSSTSLLNSPWRVLRCILRCPTCKLNLSTLLIRHISPGNINLRLRLHSRRLMSSIRFMILTMTLSSSQGEHNRHNQASSVTLRCEHLPSHPNIMHCREIRPSATVPSRQQSPSLRVILSSRGMIIRNRDTHHLCHLPYSQKLLRPLTWLLTLIRLHLPASVPSFMLIRFRNQTYHQRTYPPHHSQHPQRLRIIPINHQHGKHHHSLNNIKKLNMCHGSPLLALFINQRQ